MIIITGMNYAGKTTVKNRLMGRLGLKESEKYTTKPMTYVEAYNAHCKVVSEEDFATMCEKGTFAWVSKDANGDTFGITTAEFLDETKVMELDFDTYREMEQSIPTGTKVVYVDADVDVRYHRGLDRGLDETNVFYTIHADNFKDTLIRGIRVDNSRPDHGEYAAENAMYSLENEYPEYGMIYAKKIVPRKEYVKPRVQEPKLCRFLDFEHWSITRAISDNDMSTLEGLEAAKAQYIEDMDVYACQKMTPAYYKEYPTTIVIKVGGAEYTVVEDKKLSIEPFVKTLSRK